MRKRYNETLRQRKGLAFLFSRVQHIVLVLAVVATNAACLVRARRPDPRPVIGQTASLDELTARIEQFDVIQTLRATVQLQLSFVTDDEQLQELSNVNGFILIQRPDDIRVLAQVPVVRTTALEMASTGETFQVHLPTKDRFLVGDATSNKPSPKRVENIRPQHILEAILIASPRDNLERPALENTIEGQQAYHVVNLIGPAPGEGALRLSRKIWFERTNLEIVRQQVYDAAGDVATDVWYREWALEESVPFPHHIFVSRPTDGYTLQVRILKMALNVDLPENAFVLEPPPGTKVERVGETPEAEERAGR